MSKSLEITRDIVVAAYGSLHINGFVMDQSTGKLTADFIQEVYNKVKELEDPEGETVIKFDAETQKQINEYGR